MKQKLLQALAEEIFLSRLHIDLFMEYSAWPSKPVNIPIFFTNSKMFPSATKILVCVLEYEAASNLTK